MGAILVLLERRGVELKAASLQACRPRAGSRMRRGRRRRAGVRRGGGSVAAVAGAHGADQSVRRRGRVARLYVPEVYAATLAGAATSAAADTMLVAGTSLGRDVAARVAARLGTGLLSDVVELERIGGGRRCGESARSTRGRPMRGRPCRTPVPRWPRCAPTFSRSSPATPRAVEVVPLARLPSRCARGSSGSRRRPPQELDVAEAVDRRQRRPRPEGARALRADPRPGRRPGRRGRRVARGRRRRAGSPHAHQVGQTGKVGLAESLHRLRHLGRDPAPRRDVVVQGHRRHQQRPRGADLQGGDLRDRGRRLRWRRSTSGSNPYSTRRAQ